MKRNRILYVATTSYIVSSYSSHTGVDLRDKFSRKLLISTVNRAEARFHFKQRRLKIGKDNFVLTLTSPYNDGRMLPKILQWVKSVFAKAWNKRYGLQGAFWADRYDSEVLVTGNAIRHFAVLAHYATFIRSYTINVRRRLRGTTGYPRLLRILLKQ